MPPRPRKVPLSPDFRHYGTLTSSRKGTVHGLSLWFESYLGEDIMFASGPGRESSVYGMAFFPFLSPLNLEEGEEITVELEAKLVGEGYVWRWTTQSEETTMRQSSFLGNPLSPSTLEKRAPSFASETNTLGRAVQSAMGLMQDNRPNREIAEHLIEQFPGEFPTVRDALHLVGKLAEKYSR